MRVVLATSDAHVAAAVEDVAAERGYDVVRSGTGPLIVADGSDLRAFDARDAVVVAVVGDDAEVEFAADNGASYVLVRPVDRAQVARTLSLGERAVRLAAHREPQPPVGDRLRALGTLAGGVGHEINNPLTYIIGNLGLIVDMADEVAKDRPDWAREFVELIHEVEEGVSRIRQIVRDLETFSHPDTERTELVDMRRVIQAMIAMARNEIRHRAAIERDIEEHVPPVLGNVGRIGQVVLNLLINAAQALPVGEAARQTIRVSLGFDGGRVVVSVSDTGPGIPPEIRERIFEPFFSTREVGLGSGLGLAICHSIVTGMGGEIAVDSEPGQGATFTVWLPAAKRSIEAKQPQATERLRTHARILVVDDEPGVVAMLRRALEGHHVEAADSGRQALDRIKSGDFDLVLCDLMMPEISGMDVFLRLRRESPGKQDRIAFITGGAFTPVARQFLRDNEPPYLEKPFTMSDVRKFVDDLLATSRDRGTVG